MNPSPRIGLTLFSNPMMGLAYECEPTLDHLERHYGSALELRHAMVVLVRDVTDFMTTEERALPPTEGLSLYNARLAQIYLNEEHIGGLPMNMTHFHLFDEEHRTSEPLCLAFEAVRIADSRQAESYLRAIRRATIVEGRMTTRAHVLRELASTVGIELAAFDRALADGTAQHALAADMQLAAMAGVRGLPSLLVRVGNTEALTSPLMGYDQLRRLIDAMAAE